MKAATEHSAGTTAATNARPSVPRLGSRDRLRLITEVSLSYWLVRRSMARRNIAETVELVRAAPRRDGLLLTDPLVEGRRLGHVVTRTLRWIPARTACLIRSLVLLRMLASRGVSGQLVISVRPLEAATITAHAWIEVDDRPLLQPALEQQRLAVL